VIVALAGRRIDAPDAIPERFPSRCIAPVRERLRAALRERRASALVCAAACGADLIALALAEELGLRRRIVLPFAGDDFRRRSVVDRPGDWGEPFDRLVAEAAGRNDLEILGLPAADPGVFQSTNAAILDRALALARETDEPACAFAVWDGPLTGHTDYTQDFVETAQRRGIPVQSIAIVDAGKE
jgi:hypothetical protein